MSRIKQLLENVFDPKPAPILKARHGFVFYNATREEFYASEHRGDYWDGWQPDFFTDAGWIPHESTLRNCCNAINDVIIKVPTIQWVHVRDDEHKNGNILNVVDVVEYEYDWVNVDEIGPVRPPKKP